MSAARRAHERLREEEMAAMTIRHLLSAADLTRDEATAILDNADRFQRWRRSAAR